MLGKKRFCENMKTRANLPANNETLGTMRLWQENNGGHKNGAGAALGKWSHGVIQSQHFLEIFSFCEFFTLLICVSISVSVCASLGTKVVLVHVEIKIVQELHLGKRSYGVIQNQIVNKISCKSHSPEIFSFVFLF